MIADRDVDVKFRRPTGGLTPGGHHLRDQLLPMRGLADYRRLPIAGMREPISSITWLAILIALGAVGLVVLTALFKVWVR